jgi:hypothetical protein
MSKEVLAKFIADYVGNDLSGAIYDMLRKVESIKQRRYQLDVEFRRLSEEFAIAKRLLNDKAIGLQNDCLHVETSFCSDPSGGNDSYYQCLHCRKEF